MAKIVFLEDAKQNVQEHKASPQDAAELFRLAERLSEAELERMARAIDKMPQEKPQNSVKI